MLRILSRPATRLMERWLPDPFIFVVVLTLIAAAAAMLTQGTGPVELARIWGGGFWELLQFAMQMLLVLVTGYILASSPPVRRLLARMAGLARSRGGAILLVSLVSLAASWINWGFGLVVGAIFAKELARQIRVDYRLLVAAAYSGFVVWHGGLAGSIPLTIATPGHFTESQIGVIPTSQTIFSGWNLAIVVALFVVMPLVNRAMLPDTAEEVLVDPDTLAERETPARTTAMTPAERLENSPLLMYLIGIPGLLWLLLHFTGGGALNLNVVNFLFLFLGIVLHGSPRSMLNALDDAMRGGAGIVIQFPFYAGIMAIMIQSGLAASMSEWFVSISTAETLPFWSFISAGIVNVFVPSGGGQWAVQAPVMLPAAEALGADAARVAMGVAWGDAWTNLLQPFWALPMLGIAGLKARDIMGFCVVQLLITGVVIGGILLLI
ncbi:short-chain fatty acid transporter [Paracoccus sp. 1_MG-2023]|uniref:short-chain fatty acid transporter n=1 Tax=unclassified Paracoccus (in: a-proteobacteria) TaxID=2688777 RepID=UPI001C0A21C3|nr:MULTISPECIES: short-chain fatty acid transporter [unclassified Paracoccus (in: a-proteobacteria)]MBU2956990.1 short-chain fatty acid transporter [Paracoccus sp. C2R09]MDO6668187.1 short-chain fatty acid transporter [Paracoccus sp. 1_MG-2023]